MYLQLNIIKEFCRLRFLDNNGLMNSESYYIDVKRNLGDYD